MAQTNTVYINFTGGIVSPGYLKEVLETAAQSKVSHVRFGLRQQLIVEIPVKQFAAFSKACFEKNISFWDKKTALPNIVSSYPAAGIFTTETWLREGVYKDIFSSFDYIPRLKINICDSTQGLVPFFTGHINWISSPSTHFWYLYIRFPKTQAVYCYPELIYTNDICLLSKKIEQVLLEQGITKDEGNSLYKAVQASVSYVSKAVVEALRVQQFAVPYYEGFNRYENNSWLGIYRRDELYPVSFLLEVCSLCMQTKIGQLYTSPWKSIVVKGIETEDRHHWDFILGKYRINVRHAANELNWQVEDDNEEGLMLKRHVIRHFDKEDVRTFGLCFAVQVRPHSGMFGSVIIRKQEVKNAGKLKSLDRFEILYTRDFNSNSFDVVSFRQNVVKEYLGTYLVSLCKMFYEQQIASNAPASLVSSVLPVHTGEAVSRSVYQCSICYNVYDESVGDSENNIEAHTSFEALPETYHCTLCEAGKEKFVAVEENQLFAL